MKPVDTPSKKNVSLSALLLVSIFILVTDACFVWINYRSDWKSLQQKQHQRASYEKQAFSLALSTVATTMQQIASMVAHDPEVQQLFLQARRAVEREGGGPGGPDAARIRAELYDHLDQVWSEMTDRYDVRQLHFHLPPGSLSFLRVHKPEKFGDTMHDVRFTIVDANKNQLPVKGFETGRVYSGIRGVAPVFATDPQSGERIHVGALEAGTSFETLLQDLSETFDSNFAVLLSWEHVQRNMWQPSLQQRFPDGNTKGWVVEQGATEAENLLLTPAVRELLQSREQATLLMTDTTPPLAVNSFPLHDYRSRKEGLEPVGRLLEWRDISPEMQVFRGMLLTNILYGLFGFLLIELLLFFAWRVASGRLNALVRRRTNELVEASSRLNREANERLRAEQALRERAEQYRAIFDDNSCIMLLVEPRSGAIVRANEAAARFYGYDIATLQQMPISDINIMPQEALDQALADTDNAVSKRHEFTHRLANGEERIVAVHSGPMYFEGQRVLFSIVHDITTTKTMERQLREAMEELEAIFDNSQVSVALLDENRNFLRVNQRFLELSGYERDEVIGQNASLLHLNEESYKEFGERFYPQLQTEGVMRQVEYPLKRKDGRVLTCQVSAKVIHRQELGACIVTVADDITETRLMEQQLRETLEELEAIFENSQVGVVLLRGGRTVSRVNWHFCELLGYAPEEVQGQSVELFHISQKHFEDFGKLHFESLKQGARRQIEFPLRRKDGTSVWCLISGKALSPPDLEKGVIWVASDITALKEAERMREDVQRIMRHDLKTPLNSIMGVPQLLRLEGGLDQEQLNLLDFLEDGAKRMLSIIDLSLDLIKIESGTYQLKPQDVDLAAILATVERELGDLQRRKNQRCVATLEGAPLESGKPLVVLGEERLCYTIMANLLRNAFEAAPRDSVVSVDFSRDKSMLHMQMRNPGDVPEEVCEHFFEKYATWGKSEGTGLGTYSARLAVEIQGGRISMHCRDGVTSLDVWLPAV